MLRKKIIRHKISMDKSDFIKRLAGNQTIQFIIRSKKYLIFRSNNEYKAILDNCPHQNKSMKGAICEDGFITCPIHQYKFSATSGKGHGLSLDIYEIVFEEEDVIMIEVKPGWF